MESWAQIFSGKVNKNGPVPNHRPELGNCWVIVGYAESSGDYGKIRVKGKRFKAHRLSYELHYGIKPKKMLVCHHCDNRACIRPSHLFIGTQADNSHDRDKKGRGVMPNYVPPHRRAKGERNGQSGFTTKQILDIRHRWDNASKRHGLQTQLAKEYSTTQANIWLIINRKNWKHL
jgi:hypothetical protein